MLNFNNNHIFTGYIKQLLASFNLPSYKVYKKDYYDFLATHGVEDPRIIASEEKEGGTYPQHMLYVNYIKDNLIQRYYKGAWHPTTHHYHYNKKELNQTRTLKVKDNVYTSDVHEYLGEYLRFQRDYNNLDLMPLYNCFSNRLCLLLQTSFNVPLYVPTYEEDGTISDNYEVREVTIDSSDSAYKIYMFPIKLFEQYTIAISASEADIFCGLYGAYFDTRDKFSVLPTLTYQHYSPLQFTRPILYNKLSTENLTAGEVRAAELAQVEKNLKMFIRVPADTSSSITVLEGDYTAYNKSIFAPKLQWNEDESKVSFVNDTDYAYTTYYYDDWIARFFGKNLTQKMDTSTDKDDNDYTTKTTLDISTIFDYIPSKPNAEIIPYTKQQADDRFKAYFLNSARLKETANITLTDLLAKSTQKESYSASISGLDSKLLIITGNYYIDTTNENKYKIPFTYPGNVSQNFYYDVNTENQGFEQDLDEPAYHIPKPDDGTRPGANPDNVIIYPDKEDRYYPTYADPAKQGDFLTDAAKALIDKQKFLRAQYTITITTPVEVGFTSDNFGAVTLVLSGDTLGVTINGEAKESVVVTEEYLIYKKTADEQTVADGDENTVIPGEPLSYNLRTTRLPKFPVSADDTEIGTCEVSESISKSEIITGKVPTLVENGFIAFSGQIPVSYVTDKETDESKVSKLTSGTLYNQVINSHLKVDQVSVRPGLYETNDAGEKVYYCLTPESIDLPQKIECQLALTGETSWIQLDIDRAAKVNVYCDTNNPDNNKLLLSYKKSEQPVNFNEDGSPAYVSLKECGTSEVKHNSAYNPSHKITFNIKNAGSYLITGLFDDTRQRINISYIEVIYSFLPSGGWEASTNKYVTNFETEGLVDYHMTDENGEDIAYQELTPYPAIEERKFIPITTLQLLQYNTGISYPFADRLLEYLIGNAISHVDTIGDNVRRVQKVMRDNGNEFDIDGAWDGKMRNIIYDYMTNGHPNGETFSMFVNHDILGYVDKDVERLYTSWIRQICYDKNGNPIIEKDENGEPVYKVVNKMLITNGFSYDGIPEKNDVGNSSKYLTEDKSEPTDPKPDPDKLGRYLLVDDVTYEPVYKSKYVPTGTIMNADIYHDTKETTN